jgi:hypothetical protein
MRQCCCISKARVISRSFRGCGWNDYTFGMDSVRFGRALGFGARAAAKTLVKAVDAATSPNPSAGVGAKQGAASSQAVASRPASTSTSATGKAEASRARLGEQAARTTAQVRLTGRGLKQGSKRFGEAVGGRLVTLSGVLWLELTGVFFGIFALFAAGGAWKIRAALYETANNHDAHVRFLITATMALIFGYFCVSSFVKANRRSRRR